MTAWPTSSHCMHSRQHLESLTVLLVVLGAFRQMAQQVCKEQSGQSWKQAEPAEAGVIASAFSVCTEYFCLQGIIIVSWPPLTSAAYAALFAGSKTPNGFPIVGPRNFTCAPGEYIKAFQLAALQTRYGSAGPQDASGAETCVWDTKSSLSGFALSHSFNSINIKCALGTSRAAFMRSLVKHQHLAA